MTVNMGVMILCDSIMMERIPLKKSFIHMNMGIKDLRRESAILMFQMFLGDKMLTISVEK